MKTHPERHGRPRWMRTAALFAALIGLAACQMSGSVETRTFQLTHLDTDEAQRMIDPYVYGDREGAPGAISWTQGTITVRELPENLDRIAAVLAQYDRPRVAVRFHFMLIEADGYTEADPAIAEVESELRTLFGFDGYRLAAQTAIQTVEGGGFQQTVGDGYEIAGNIYDISGDASSGAITMGIELGGLFSSTVSVPIGETVVLGSGRPYLLESGPRAVILVVRPELLNATEATR